MNSQMFENILEHVSSEIERLPASAVQLVGALIALQADIPEWFGSFLMYRLGQRADMTQVYPAAEALMRLSIHANYAEMDFARREIQTQHDLLKAIALHDKVFVAAAFLHRLAEYLEKFEALDRTFHTESSTNLFCPKSGPEIVKLAANKLPSDRSTE